MAMTNRFINDAGRDRIEVGAERRVDLLKLRPEHFVHK
jgi:hypothetical protein